MDEKAIYSLIAGRRTVHRFKEAEIERNLIERALELAIMAPNHKFTFPWHFCVLGKKSQQAVYEMALEKSLKKMELTGEDQEMVEKGTKEKFLNPATMVVFARKHNDDPIKAYEDYATISCSIQNFTTYLSGCGYDSKWSSGSISKSDTLYQISGIDNKDMTIEGLLIVGKSMLGQYPPRRRPDFDDVVKWVE